MSGFFNTDKANGRKPAAASDKNSTDVCLKVTSQKFKTMHFRMLRHTPLQQLVDVYTGKYDVFSFQFLYNGQRINPKLTALQFGMKDGDEIDAMLHADGGGRLPLNVFRYDVEVSLVRAFGWSDGEKPRMFKSRRGDGKATTGALERAAERRRSGATQRR
ncbi:small ubiquitin-related modifier 1-like [Argentina anserina]|uniref:small ubiquitin-related modifier 1-like n=1 Tax=Argentina anserina TaxID=57926 RepID=UPI0021767DA7|nr:small ubiquitin-related modifier 1-like [Potentilla anserina]